MSSENFKILQKKKTDTFLRPIFKKKRKQEVSLRKRVLISVSKLRPIVKKPKPKVKKPFAARLMKAFQRDSILICFIESICDYIRLDDEYNLEAHRNAIIDYMNGLLQTTEKAFFNMNKVSPVCKRIPSTSITIPSPTNSGIKETYASCSTSSDSSNIIPLVSDLSLASSTKTDKTSSPSSFGSGTPPNSDNQPISSADLCQQLRNNLYRRLPFVDRNNRSVEMTHLVWILGITPEIVSKMGF